METNYLRYSTQKEIALHIQWLCKMGDMLPPQGKATEFISFLQLTFGKYDIQLLPKAFSYWASGNLPNIRPVKTINMFFISTLLNAYLEVNGRAIPTEPIKYLTEPKNDLKNEIDYEFMLGECKKDIVDFDNWQLKAIYWSRWSKCYYHFCTRINIINLDIDPVCQKIIDWDGKYYASVKNGNGKQIIKQIIANYESVKNSENYRNMIEEAAKFYQLVKLGKV